MFCFLESACCDETHCFVQIIHARKTKTNKQNPEKNTPSINEGLSLSQGLPQILQASWHNWIPAATSVTRCSIPFYFQELLTDGDDRWRILIARSPIQALRAWLSWPGDGIPFPSSHWLMPSPPTCPEILWFYSLTCLLAAVGAGGFAGWIWSLTPSQLWASTRFAWLSKPQSLTW